MIGKEVHFQDYLQIILRRRWIIITFFTVLVVTVLIGSLKQTPIYRAIATIMIERRSPQVISVKEVTPMGASDYYAYKDYYETQYKLITCRTVMEKVAESLNLEEVTAQKGSYTAEKLGRIVSVVPVKNSQLVRISAEVSSPEVAAKIANTVADKYIKQNLERNISASSDAGQWLEKKIEEQRKKLKNAEVALQNYREEHNINILPQLTDEEVDDENIKAEYVKAQAMLANYLERYTEEHPKVIELRAQINSLKNKIQGLEGVDTSSMSMEYRVLEREVQTNKRMYEVLVTRLKEIDLSSTLNVNNVSMVETAQVPKQPVKPNVKLNILLAAIVGLVGGAGLGFFVDYLDTTIKSPEDIKSILNTNFLGAIPGIQEIEELKRDKIVHLEPYSPISEAYRCIRTEILQLLSKREGRNAMVITSGEPQAGKTMTLTNIGIALAQAGNNVLLVDCDLRRPQLDKVFNLTKERGLSEYLRGEISADSMIKDTEIDNLKVITSGKIPQNPSEIIGSNKMKEFIGDVKIKFDFILFDSPPVISVTDAVILADMLDAVIQVVRSGKALVPIAMRANENLSNTQAEKLGVILNDVKTYHGDYYYYYRYYRYYGQDGKRRSASRRGKNSKEEIFLEKKEEYADIASG
ncbi:MAG: polysaccharide biosynthesis tyrosine autokinase [Candidatus Omnitrophota bacterium]